MSDISERTEAEAHAVLDKPQAWITYVKKDGRGRHSGTIATNPDYVKVHKDWVWLPLKLPEPPK
jgi:hypothetical protein